MLGGQARQLLKRALVAVRVKLVYERITLTRCTKQYFFFAILAGIVLSSLQIASLVNDSEAVSRLSSIVKANPVPGIAILNSNTLEVCCGLPNDPATKCQFLMNFSNLGKRDTANEENNDNDVNEDQHTPTVDVEVASIIRADSTATQPPLTISSSSFSSSPTRTLSTTVKNQNTVISLPSSTAAATNFATVIISSTSAPMSSPTSALSDTREFGDNCIETLKWLKDTIQDSQREDVVALLFQIWLFVNALVTILNESIPHLGAALLGQMLGTAWAGYRVHSTQSLMHFYKNDIVPQACSGRDFLGDWWSEKLDDAIPIVALSAATLLGLAYFSSRLYGVYTSQTLKRFGASEKIHRLYKFVLFFSLCLQLSGFLSLASTAMWIDKVSHGSLAEVAYSKVYLAGFIVILLFQLPWLVLGWICVRREYKIVFAIFCGISAVQHALSISMFSSKIYQYIFATWPFFSTITITAFIFLVGTVLIGLLCRMNFGKGLAQSLQDTQTDEDIIFTPVYFASSKDGGDREKSGPLVLEAPGVRFSGIVHLDSLPSADALRSERRKAFLARGSSIYSDNNASPIILTASVPLASELPSAPSPRTSTVSKAIRTLSMLTSPVSLRSKARISVTPSISSLPNIARTNNRYSTESLYAPSESHIENFAADSHALNRIEGDRASKTYVTRIQHIMTQLLANPPPQP